MNKFQAAAAFFISFAVGLSLIAMWIVVQLEREVERMKCMMNHPAGKQPKTAHSPTGLMSATSSQFDRESAAEFDRLNENNQPE